MTRSFLLAITALTAGPALAVGLGPLRHEGVTATDRKGFYLTLLNPYASAERFRLNSVGMTDETPQPRIRIPVDQPLLPGKGQRRLLVVATHLQPGETLHFRVCAERVEPPGKDFVHARVCAKLSAHRLG